MSQWEGFEELVKVVEVGSFSGAARALGVSKGHIRPTSQPTGRSPGHTAFTPHNA